MSPILLTCIAVTSSVSMIVFKVQAMRLRPSGIKGISTQNASGQTEEPDPVNASGQTVEPDPVEHGYPKIATWKHGWHNINPHYFVFHARNCHDYNPAAQTNLGCHLKDFGTADKLVGAYRDAHWNLQHWSRGLDYGRYSAQDGSNVSRRKGQEFHMPDYCSRAIISELSTVYSRGRRNNSLIAALKNNSISLDCSGFKDKKRREDMLFNPEVRARSCWNFVADYRKVYCLGYQRCAVCEDASDANCHLNSDLVQCCSQAYTERIAERLEVLPPKRKLPPGPPPARD